MITLKINMTKLLFTETDGLMYEIKLKRFMKILGAIKKCLILVITRLSQNAMMIQTDLSLEKWNIKLEVLRLKNLLE